MNRSLHRAARSGMTLVEIVVVIALLGFIMSLLAVGINGARQGANQDATVLAMKSLESKLEMYNAKKKKYPTTSEGLDALKKYFDDGNIPTDAWGNPFQYYSPGTHSEKHYELMSFGADGAEGGEGWDQDIKSWALSELE